MSYPPGLPPGFELPATGFFIEVGAFDGETNSFTCGLADAGWSGIYIEPIREYARQCKRRHYRNAPRVRVFNMAVGADLGRLKLWKYGQITTAKEEVKALWDSPLMRKFIEQPQWEEVFVPMLPLKTFIPKGKIDLLVVDCEGMEGEVLSTLQKQPSFAIIETHEKSEDWAGINVDVKFFKDYQKVYSDDTNTFFKL